MIPIHPSQATQPVHTNQPVFPNQTFNNGNMSIQMTTNPLNQDQQMNLYISNQKEITSQEKEVEVAAYKVLKGAPQLNVERHESCFQCYWEKRDTTYNSLQLGSHKVERFQLNLVNLAICWPWKLCCCTFKMPRFIENHPLFNSNNVYVHFAGRNSGFISANGIVLGTFEIEHQSCLALCCSSTRPTVYIKKAVTNEQLTLKPEDGCLKGILERYIGFCLTEKTMIIGKGGSISHGTYSRSCFQAVYNFFTNNGSFYNKLDIDFQNFIKSDADKLLFYGAFIFLQENTNGFRGCFC